MLSKTWINYLGKSIFSECARITRVYDGQNDFEKLAF